jgi:hypothetical protein
MREKRRKETKEKIRREEEAKGKKGKGKGKDSRAQGHLTKVFYFPPCNGISSNCIFDFSSRRHSF